MTVATLIGYNDKFNESEKMDLFFTDNTSNKNVNREHCRVG